MCVLFHPNLFFLVSLLPVCFLVEEGKKECGIGWEERWGRSVGVEGGETAIRIYCMKNLFLKTIIV